MSIYTSSSAYQRKFLIKDVANPWAGNQAFGPLNLDGEVSAGAGGTGTAVPLPTNTDLFCIIHEVNGRHTKQWWLMKFFPLTVTPAAADLTLANSLIIPRWESDDGYTELNTYRIPLGVGGLRGGQTAPWFYRLTDPLSGRGTSKPLNIIITITNKTDAVDPEQQIRGDL